MVCSRAERVSVTITPFADGDANASSLFTCDVCPRERRGDMMGRYDGKWLCDGCLTMVERTEGLTQEKADKAAGSDPTPV